MELNNKSTVWSFTKTQLDSNDKIRFYFFKIDDPKIVEDIGEAGPGQIEDYSKRYRAYIEPKFLP